MADLAKIFNYIASAPETSLDLSAASTEDLLASRMSIVLNAAADRSLEIETDPNRTHIDTAEAHWLGQRIARIKDMHGLSAHEAYIHADIESYRLRQLARFWGEDKLDLSTTRHLNGDVLRRGFDISLALSQLFCKENALFGDFNLVAYGDDRLAVAYTAPNGIHLGSWNDIEQQRADGRFSIGTVANCLGYTDLKAYCAIAKAQRQLGQLPLTEHGDWESWYGGTGVLLLTGERGNFRPAFGNASASNLGVCLFKGPPGITREFCNPDVSSPNIYVRPFVPLSVWR